MIPAIGDTINNRYTLIAQFRSHPGLNAWLANDHTLKRDCQLYIVSDQTKLTQINAIASTLVLTRRCSLLFSLFRVRTAFWLL